MRPVYFWSDETTRYYIAPKVTEVFFAWKDAEAFAYEFRCCGFNDWRMPSMYVFQAALKAQKNLIPELEQLTRMDYWVSDNINRPWHAHIARRNSKDSSDFHKGKRSKGEKSWLRLYRIEPIFD